MPLRTRELLIASPVSASFLNAAGNLFHEAKPSRTCIHRTMRILRKHCIGDNAVHIKVSVTVQQRHCTCSAVLYPSLSTLSYRSRASCLQIISEQGSHFPVHFPEANYDCNDFNVGMPVFSIHGSNDEPGRDGGGGPARVSCKLMISLESYTVTMS